MHSPTDKLNSVFEIIDFTIKSNQLNINTAKFARINVHNQQTQMPRNNCIRCQLEAIYMYKMLISKSTAGPGSDYFANCRVVQKK